MTDQLISKGAEAYIYLTEYLGIKAIKKIRIRKPYRSEFVDARIRKFRTKREAKLLSIVKKLGVPCPAIYDLNLLRYTLVLEFIEGVLLRDVLIQDRLPRDMEEMIFTKIGQYVGMMHASDIIHGDLTTSNIILTPSRNIVFIDFGLGTRSASLEEKGIEIRVFYTSLNSRHYDKIDHLFDAFIHGYRETNPHANKVMEKFREISMRGRYVASRRERKFMLP